MGSICCRTFNQRYRIIRPHFDTAYHMRQYFPHAVALLHPLKGVPFASHFRIRKRRLFDIQTGLFGTPLCFLFRTTNQGVSYFTIRKIICIVILFKCHRGPKVPSLPPPPPSGKVSDCRTDNTENNVQWDRVTRYLRWLAPNGPKHEPHLANFKHHGRCGAM